MLSQFSSYKNIPIWLLEEFKCLCYNLIFILGVWVSGPHVSLHLVYVKAIRDPSGQELQIGVSHPMVLGMEFVSSARQ